MHTFKNLKTEISLGDLITSDRKKFKTKCGEIHVITVIVLKSIRLLIFLFKDSHFVLVLFFIMQTLLSRFCSLSKVLWLMREAVSLAKIVLLILNIIGSDKTYFHDFGKFRKFCMSLLFWLLINCHKWEINLVWQEMLSKFEKLVTKPFQPQYCQ